MINSLARGAQILRLLAEHPVSLGVTEVAERLRVDPSTAYRLLATLEAHDLVVQDEASKKYSIGYGVLEIASGLLHRFSVVEISRPFMQSVAARTGENTHVAVRNGCSAISLGSESATGILRVETTLGTAEPLHCSAIGKALLTDYAHEELATLFGDHVLERFTPNTITTLDELEADLIRTRRIGYAFDDEELHPGVRCIASPVRDRSGAIVAAFGLSTPSIRLTRERMPELAALIRESAAQISAQMGFVAQDTAASP